MNTNKKFEAKIKALLSDADGDQLEIAARLLCELCEDASDVSEDKAWERAATHFEKAATFISNRSGN